jgi:chemotaxis protein CheX
MNENATAEQIASTIGLQAIPENVRRLTDLVSRQDAPMQDITKLICQDKELTGRLLRAANPRASSEDEYVVTSVDAALMRAGVGCALLLAMSDPLIRAVKRTFETMIGADLKDVAAGILVPLEKEHVIGEVAFEGKATGCVNLRLSPTSAGAVAATVLGFETEDPADVNDVIGELSNMVVGNFKSNLCDAGLSCKLNPPKIGRTNEFKLRASGGGLAERTGFRAPDIEIFVDILVNPWND